MLTRGASLSVVYIDREINNVIPLMRDLKVLLLQIDWTRALRKMMFKLRSRVGLSKAHLKLKSSFTTVYCKHF